jgi:flagellar biosynthesis protein FliR
MNPEAILAEFSQQQVLGFMLVLARISPLFLLAPLFSSKLLPARARGIVAVGLALGIAPIAMNAGEDAARIPTEILALGGLVVKEMLVGLGFSFSLAALFAAVQVAGSLADLMVGFSFGALVDPVTGTNGGVLNQLYALVGVMIFVAIGGDAWVIQGLARSYDAVPLTEAPAIGTLVEGAQVAFSGIFGAAIEICAPVLLAALLTDVAFGLVSRVMPQLNVFGVGFPAKITVGLVLVGASLPFVAGWLSDELQSSVSSALQTLRVAG